MSLNESLLDQKLEALERARAWSPRVISKLEGALRTADDWSLFRINPLKFGQEKGIAEAESIDLFLHAAHVGLVEMNWHLLCPGCAMLVKSFRELHALGTSFRCDLCAADFQIVLDDYVEVSFTISPSVREIAPHRPELLPIEEFFFKYTYSQNAIQPPDHPFPPGTRFVEGMRQFTKILTYIEPGEKKRFELDLDFGALNGFDPLLHATPQYSVRGSGSKELSIKISDGRYRPGVGQLAAGKVPVEFENAGTQRAALIMVFLPIKYTGAAAVFEPFLSGNRLLSTQTFRDLFRTEVIRGSQGLSVRDITVLFTDLKGSTALYDRIGDLKAFELVQRHFDAIGKVIHKHSGALVKTIGDAVMATFLHPVDAAKAAVDMLGEIEAFNYGLPAKELMLKVGIHRGASIAVTLNDRLDYFGQTVNIAARVQGLADAEQIYVTHEVYSQAGVSQVLEPFHIASERARLRGVQDEMQVYKVSRRGPG